MLTNFASCVAETAAPVTIESYCYSTKTYTNFNDFILPNGSTVRHSLPSTTTTSCSVMGTFASSSPQSTRTPHPNLSRPAIAGIAVGGSFVLVFLTLGFIFLKWPCARRRRSAAPDSTARESRASRRSRSSKLMPPSSSDNTLVRRTGSTLDLLSGQTSCPANHAAKGFIHEDERPRRASGSSHPGSSPPPTEFGTVLSEKSYKPPYPQPTI